MQSQTHSMSLEDVDLNDPWNNHEWYIYKPMPLHCNKVNKYNDKNRCKKCVCVCWIFFHQQYKHQQQVWCTRWTFTTCNSLFIHMYVCMYMYVLRSKAHHLTNLKKNDVHRFLYYIEVFVLFFTNVQATTTHFIIINVIFDIHLVCCSVSSVHGSLRCYQAAQTYSADSFFFVCFVAISAHAPSNYPYTYISSTSHIIIIASIIPDQMMHRYTSCRNTRKYFIIITYYSDYYIFIFIYLYFIYM